jgi:hypothetical protein
MKTSAGYEVRYDDESVGRIYEIRAPTNPELLGFWSITVVGAMAGPDANSNNNVRGDMPFDRPFGERLQRSSQLAVVRLGHRHCQGKAPHCFATTEVRRVPQSRTRLPLKFQRC